LNNPTSAARGKRRTAAEQAVGPDNLATVPAPPLRLRLLGEFLLVCGDEVIGISSARIQSLLAQLALHRDVGQSRQQLAFLFWPDSSEAQARNNLRQLVHQLRRIWPEMDGWLTVNASRLAWRRELDLALDVDAFEGALARADAAERAVNLPSVKLNPHLEVCRRCAPGWPQAGVERTADHLARSQPWPAALPRSGRGTRVSASPDSPRSC
jgi:hypothetical protein